MVATKKKNIQEEVKVDQVNYNDNDRRKWKREKSSPNVVGALFLIFLGLIFLLNNGGIIPWSVWKSLWEFWPIFLILAGIKSILGRGVISNYIIGLLAIIVFGAILANALREVNSPLFYQLKLNRLPIYTIFEQLKVDNYYE